MKWIVIDSLVMERRVPFGSPFPLLPWERVVRWEEVETEEELRQRYRRCSRCRKYGVATHYG